MQIANHTFSLDMATQSPPGSPPVAAVKPRKVFLNISVSPEIKPATFSIENDLSS